MTARGPGERGSRRGRGPARGEGARVSHPPVGEVVAVLATEGHADHTSAHGALAIGDYDVEVEYVPLMNMAKGTGLLQGKPAPRLVERFPQAPVLP